MNGFRSASVALRSLPFDRCPPTLCAWTATDYSGAWQDRNTTATLPHCVDQLEARGNLNNMRRVTGDYDGAFTGYWFADTDNARRGR